MVATLVILLVIFTAATSDVDSKPGRAHFNLTKNQVKLLDQLSTQFTSRVAHAALFRQTSSADCGRSDSFSNRIVGGVEANVNEFPWQAQLIVKDSDEFFGCGGTLINNQWILTAAHCVEGSPLVYVILGTRNSFLDTEQDSMGLVSKLSSYNIHPLWNNKSLSNDMALLKLPSPVQFNNAMRPICLPFVNEGDHINEEVIVSGWGYQSDASLTLSPKLMNTKTTVIPNAVCAEFYGNRISANHMCTDGSDGRGACEGDSGGPLMIVLPNGTFVQLGVVSFGSNEGCEKGHPDVYGRVSSYVKWISETATTENASPSTAVSLYLLFFSLYLQLF